MVLLISHPTAAERLISCRVIPQAKLDFESPSSLSYGYQILRQLPEKKRPSSLAAIGSSPRPRLKSLIGLLTSRVIYLRNISNPFWNKALISHGQIEFALYSAQKRRICQPWCMNPQSMTRMAVGQLIAFLLWCSAVGFEAKLAHWPRANDTNKEQCNVQQR